VGKEVIKDASLFLHSQQLASNTNAVSFAVEAEEIDATTFGIGGNKEFVAGLRNSSLSCELILETSAVAPESALEALLDAETDAPFTVTRNHPPADGDVAWFANVVTLGLTLKQAIGALWSGTMKFGNRSRAVRGNVLESALGVNVRAATGTGASLTMPAVAAGEKLVAAVHVISATGTTPTLDLIIESDSTSGFPSGTTRVTVPQFIAVGSYYVVIDGPITDTEYRVSATVGGTTPAFEYLVAIAIAAF